MAVVSAEEHAKVVARLEEALAERDRQIAELKEQVAALLAKLDQNSSNSNLPPSSDGPGATSRGVRPSKKRKGAKRKRGGQKGRRGSHRQFLPPDRVHDFVDHFPEACERCASPLPQKLDADARRYQLVDLRDGALHVAEHRRHGVTCGCGHTTLAAYDREAMPSSPFGPGLITAVAMLTGVYHLSRREARRLLRDFFQLPVSVGAISRMEERASKALVAAVDEAERDVEDAPVKHADATSWLLAGVTLSLWTLCTELTTLYRIFKDGPLGAFGRELLDCAALVFEYWHGFKHGLLTREELEVWMRPVQRQFEAALRRAVAANVKELSGSCADILAHREALWTFVVHDGVGPTNNLAERDLRRLVLWRRRSFGSRSERGLRFVERIMTVSQTLGKRGKWVFEFVREAVAAHLEGRPQPSLLAA